MILVAPTTLRAAQESEHQPDVLFIAIDDLNDWVGCLGGHEQVRTPNIDRLAERSVLFSNAHCQAPMSLTTSRDTLNPHILVSGSDLAS